MLKIKYGYYDQKQANPLVKAALAQYLSVLVKR
jgi:hypothetical protein